MPSSGRTIALASEVFYSIYNRFSRDGILGFFGKVLSNRHQPKNDDVVIQKLTDNDEFKSFSASTESGD